MLQEAGMFLRMASGLGFCQVGDYVASLFFLFRRRGHRYMLSCSALAELCVTAYGCISLVQAFVLM